MTETNQTNWVFLPVHKSRVIKDEEKYVLIEITDATSTILPKVFKRKKETEDMMFFSLPKDFNINIRTAYINKDGLWTYYDALHKLEVCPCVKELKTAIE